MLRAAGLVGLAPLGAWTGATSRGGVDLKRARRILEAADSFGRGGGYDKTWSSSGCPKPVEHKGKTILRGSDKGTYCCGWTFAVAMKALGDAGSIRSKSVEDLRRFQKVWFGATGREAVCSRGDAARRRP